MDPVIKKASLSPAKQRLLELMQNLNFGRIEYLQIRASEPVFTSATKVTRKLKIGGDNGMRPEVFREDFLLKHQTLELFQLLSTAREGDLISIDVRHGLPFAAEILYTGPQCGGSRDE